VNPDKTDIELIVRRIERAKNWVAEYAPERLRFKVAERLPENAKKLNQKQRDGLRQLANDLSSRDYSPIELHNHVYEVARKAGLDPSELFKAIYLVLIGQEFGPRIGNFISALDKDFVIGRLKEAAELRG
jgi:lysyl-tRNA synthetase class 1